MTRRGMTLVVLSLCSVLAVACGPDDPVLEPPDLTTTSGSARGACSAAGMASEPKSQAGLPDVVARTRRLLVGAATTCGYARLAHVAGRGDDAFSYSLGEEGDPTAFWRGQEAEGQEPMRFLVALLDRPYHARLVAGGTQYVWPSAFGYDTWADVPPPDRDALRPLYGDRDFEFFEQFGGYAGYRVGIDADGEWLFFIEGD
jgi:hypothetical protein